MMIISEPLIDGGIQHYRSVVDFAKHFHEYYRPTQKRRMFFISNFILCTVGFFIGLPARPTAIDKRDCFRDTTGKEQSEAVSMFWLEVPGSVA